MSIWDDTAPYLWLQSLFGAATVKLPKSFGGAPMTARRRNLANVGKKLLKEAPRLPRAPIPA